MYRKESYTKLLPSHCIQTNGHTVRFFFFLVYFFQIKGGYSQKHIHPPFIKKNEKKQAG